MGIFTKTPPAAISHTYDEKSHEVRWVRHCSTKDLLKILRVWAVDWETNLRLVHPSSYKTIETAIKVLISAIMQINRKEISADEAATLYRIINHTVARNLKNLQASLMQTSEYCPATPGFQRTLSGAMQAISCMKTTLDGEPYMVAEVIGVAYEKELDSLVERARTLHAQAIHRLSSEDAFFVSQLLQTYVPEIKSTLSEVLRSDNKAQTAEIEAVIANQVSLMNDELERIKDDVNNQALERMKGQLRFLEHKQLVSEPI